MTEQDVFGWLAASYNAREWVILPQVRDATGYAGAGRTADAIAMNCWPSRGLEIHGFEIKTYRADWLRELKNPQKAEAVFQFCDRWWAVVPDHEDVQTRAGEDRKIPATPVVQARELPPTWGLIRVSEKLARQNGRIIEVEAPKLEPQTFSRPFLANVLRAARGESPAGRIERALEEGRHAGREEGIREGLYRARQETRNWPDEAERLKYIEQSLAEALKGVREHRIKLDNDLAALGERIAAEKTG